MLLCVFALLISVTDKRYHILPSRDSIDGTIFPCHTCETRTTFIVFLSDFWQTSVSETMREAPAHQTPNCIKKTKNTFCRTRILCPIAEILRITVSSCKISPKSDNRLMTCGQKNDFCIWRPSGILNLKKNIFGHVSVTEFQICCCVPKPNFIKI